MLESGDVVLAQTGLDRIGDVLTLRLNRVYNVGVFQVIEHIRIEGSFNASWVVSEAVVARIS